MPSNDYQREARELLEQFMDRALAYEQKELAFLARKWGNVSKSLEDFIQELSEKEVLSLDQLYKLDLYKQFLRESKFEIAKFNRLAQRTIEKGQEFFIHLGLDSAQDMIGLITPRFNRINFNAVNNIIGLSSNGSKLEALFKKSYPEAVDKLTNTLITGNALGWNPTKTARLMAQNMNGNLVRAQVIARTEQINCLRMTSLQQMQKSGVLKGWVRIEKPDCCDGCAEVNGKHYGFDESWDSDYSHPNCRGAAVPDI